MAVDAALRGNMAGLVHHEDVVAMRFVRGFGRYAAAGGQDHAALALGGSATSRGQASLEAIGCFGIRFGISVAGVEIALFVVGFGVSVTGVEATLFVMGFGIGCGQSCGGEKCQNNSFGEVHFEDVRMLTRRPALNLSRGKEGFY